MQPWGKVAVSLGDIGCARKAETGWAAVAVRVCVRGNLNLGIHKAKVLPGGSEF